MMRNRIYSLIRPKTEYLQAEVAIATYAYENYAHAALN